MMQVGDAGLNNLVEYAHVVRRRFWIILATVILAGAGGYLLAKRGTPVYQASAEVLLQGSTTSDVSGVTQTSVDINTELRILQGLAIQQAVRKTLPDAAPIASATQSSDTSFIVSVDSTNPTLAADSANAYANAYLAQRRSQAVNDLLAAINQIQSKISGLQHQISTLSVPSDAGSTTQASTAQSAQFSALETELASDQSQYSNLQLQLSGVSAGGIVLRPAFAPTTPIAPRPLRTGAEAAAGGVVLGVGLAFLFEYLDDTLRTADVLERLGRPVPVLGVIPAMAGWRGRSRSTVVVATDPGSAAAEAFRYLRTGVRFAGLDRSVVAIQVTSPSSRDGKTTTVANLAVALAQAGERVAIVDFDLRRPRVNELFGLGNDVGFTSVASGLVRLGDALQTVDGVPRLSVLATGPLPPNPSELLSSARTAEILDILRAQGWLLVVDSPPLLPVTDASIVSRLVDATLLVASIGVTKKNEVRRALEVLRRVKAPLIGTVVNRAPTRRRYYDYSASTYAAADPESSQRGKRARGAERSVTEAVDVEPYPEADPPATVDPAGRALPPKRRLRAGSGSGSGSGS
ncbi:MAG TPA: polysaccharide biosynthesis tyrosine autokinase [Acidimicrobiales bacterium]|jgi:capsular exopolysaccharide synthesis family protein|nr:polysaccharide biosynthesis tyrosine autokinase [Acidimicrobiales bacterium]